MRCVVTEHMKPTNPRPSRQVLSESEFPVNVPSSELPRLQRALGVIQPRRLRVPAVALGVVVLAAACGSSGKSTTTGTTAASPSAAPSGAPSARPGTTGTISAVNPSNIFVQDTQNQTQTTVNFSATTTFTETVTTTAAALKAGDCVTATAASTNATPSARPSTGASRAPVTALTATNVIITSTSGDCTRTGGGFGGGGNPGARPSFRPSARPSGAARGGGFGFADTAFGSVASVGNGSFIVNSTRGSSTTKVTVTTTSATTYRENETVTKANLKVGLCATAIGATDDTGAVTARTIALSTPTSSGCTLGFGGGFGRGRFGGGGSGTNAAGGTG